MPIAFAFSVLLAVLPIASGAEPAPALSLSVGNVPSSRYLALHLDTTALASRIAGDRLALTAEAVEPGGRVVLSKSLSASLGQFDVQFDYGDLPPGRYACRVSLPLRDAGSARAEAPFHVPAPAVWETSVLYEDCSQGDRVLRPWTPVACGDRSASVWGRTMTWTRESLLPASIRSGNVELLAEPLTLIVTVGGRERRVPLDSLRFVERRQSRARLVAAGTVEGLRFTADVTVEYDGFAWVTLQAKDARRDRQVDALRVVVSLPAERTTLYQTFCRPLAGFIGDQPIRLPWLANAAENIVNFYHWLGSEDRGLGFTYDTLQHWRPESEESFCTLVPGRPVTTYRMNLIEKPASLAGRQFTFGLQATPIKDLPPDWHSMVSSSLSYNSWAAWQKMPEDMDTTVVWPPPRMKGLNDPYRCDPQGMADVVKYAHDRRVAVLFTGCPQKISPFSTEFEDYRLEWQTLPDSILDWEGVKHYENCARSYSLRKWLFYGWAVEIVKRFGFDGIYFDGWQGGAIACSNPHHGCGWTDENGKRHLTVPVLEGREFNRALAAFLEDNVKSPYAAPPTAPERPGFARYHLRMHSWEFVPPEMGFATSWLTGEFAAYPLHGPGMLTPEGSLGKCLGLGLLRSRCLSTNWGVPNLFHVMMWEHTENHPTDRQTLMALAWLLPHGIPLGELVYMNQKTVTEIVGAMAKLETRRARFTPCWRANSYLDVEPPVSKDVMVATWDHAPQPKVLAVVSNLAVDRSADLVLTWKGFSQPQLTNARTGEKLELRDGRLPLTLAPESFILLAASR